MNEFHQEVRRSLHHHMMQLYTAYLPDTGQEVARDIVAQELEHMATYFNRSISSPDVQDDPVETFWREREHHRDLGPYASGYLHAYAEVRRARAHHAVIQKGETE